MKLRLFGKEKERTEDQKEITVQGKKHMNNDVFYRKHGHRYQGTKSDYSVGRLNIFSAIFFI